MGQSILIIEDEPQIADLIELTLKPLRLSCKKVSSAEVAEEKLSQESYSLILIDWMLPSKQGIEFLFDLNQNPSFKKTQSIDHVIKPYLVILVKIPAT